MTPEQLWDLAERMVHKGARLAAIVHGDGGPWDVHNLIGQLGIVELRGLAVVLAAMVDPDTTVGEALAHVTWDEHYRPVINHVHGLSLRQVAERRLLSTGEAA